MNMPAFVTMENLSVALLYVGISVAMYAFLTDGLMTLLELGHTLLPHRIPYQRRLPPKQELQYSILYFASLSALLINHHRSRLIFSVDILIFYLGIAESSTQSIAGVPWKNSLIYCLLNQVIIHILVDYYIYWTSLTIGSIIIRYLRPISRRLK